MEITNKVVANAVAARNAGGGFVQYTTDSFGHVPKVGEEYRHNGKLVKCTAVTRLAAGAGGIDRYLVEGRVVNAVASYAYDVDPRKVEADANAWISAIKTAAQAKRKAAEIGKRLYDVFYNTPVAEESQEINKIARKIAAVFEDASYLNRASTAFFTTP